MTNIGLRVALAVVAMSSATACGGGAPLLHPAHVLAPGVVSLGAGVSAQAVVSSAGASSSDQSAAVLQSAAVSAGVSPWIAGRVGIADSNEAGITYTGRSVRIDGRHAFSLGAPTLSIGLGASVILPERPNQDATNGVYGGGLDLPILLGVHSRSDLYALWIGPRAGFELLRGTVVESALLPGGTSVDSTPSDQLDGVSATHLYAGGVAGLRAGFRHVHVALEVDAAYHYATGSFGALPSTSIRAFAVTPAGALILTF